MTQTIADELTRLDDAFAGNLLLSTFSSEARGLIDTLGTVTDLGAGEVVLNRGDQVMASLFPFDSTMISMAVDISQGRSVEVALIGRRGAVGGIISCGQAPAFTRAVVLVGGPAFRLPMQALEEAKRRSPFIANLICRFSDYLLSQVMQSVACNAFHSTPERAARWLLHAQDRTGDRIELTQQGLAGLLGAQRTTMNVVVQALEREGLITTARGVIQIVDRAGLMRRSCECYETIEEHFGAVIGTSGSGDAI